MYTEGLDTQIKLCSLDPFRNPTVVLPDESCVEAAGPPESCVEAAKTSVPAVRAIFSNCQSVPAAFEN